MWYLRSWKIRLHTSRQEKIFSSVATDSVQLNTPIEYNRLRLMRHLEESADDRTLLETMMEEIYLYEEVKDSPMEVPVEPVRQKKPRTIFVRPPTTTPRNAGGIPSSSIPTTSVERGQQTSPVHVAFPCRFTNFNISSTRSRLCKFLGASGAGIAEASITTERIKHLERFILYLIRYGVAPQSIDVALRLMGPPPPS